MISDEERELAIRFEDECMPNGTMGTGQGSKRWHAKQHFSVDQRWTLFVRMWKEIAKMIRTSYGPRTTCGGYFCDGCRFCGL